MILYVIYHIDVSSFSHLRIWRGPFWKVPIRQVPCPPILDISVGEGHTAVVSKSGHLYTFGDGRHGKLCHGDDNFATLHTPYLVESFRWVFLRFLESFRWVFLLSLSHNLKSTHDLLTSHNSVHIASHETLNWTLSQHDSYRTDSSLWWMSHHGYRQVWSTFSGREEYFFSPLKKAWQRSQIEWVCQY